MDKLEIIGGNALQGEVSSSGAKNAVLPILMATLLTAEECVISNVPDLFDVHTTNKLLATLGATVSFETGVAVIKAKDITSTEAPYDLVKVMRASVLVLGPLLARFGKVSVSLPGGCAIGSRPIEQHLKALEAMNAKIKIEDGYIHASVTNKLQGANIIFDVVTVTGTENVLMAAVLADGATTLENAAREPEVDDLANMLNKMGAKISGIGTDTLKIEGVNSLHGCEHSVMSDRIVTATFLVAAAMTYGNVCVTNAQPKDLDAALAKLKEAGAKIITSDTTIELSMKGCSRLKPVNIRTAPHPAFPTDLQAQFMALNAIADGTGQVTETIFENRFMHVPELNRMGAKIVINGRTATVTGVESLKGAPVMATDLRASASLVLAAVCAQGTTTIDRIYHLDRGYERIEDKLNSLGASVKRIS